MMIEREGALMGQRIHCNLLQLLEKHYMTKLMIGNTKQQHAL